MSERILFSLNSAIFALSAALFVANSAMAHGESEPGPNGGEIRMPGAFHVEAVVEDNALRVYLLDMQFENPQVSDSEVTASLERNGETRQLQCQPDKGSQTFVCRLPDGSELSKGELMVDAARGGVPGATANYELPLMQGKDAEKDMDMMDSQE